MQKEVAKSDIVATIAKSKEFRLMKQISWACIASILAVVIPTIDAETDGLRLTCRCASFTRSSVVL